MPIVGVIVRTPRGSDDAAAIGRNGMHLAEQSPSTRPVSEETESASEKEDGVEPAESFKFSNRPHVDICKASSPTHLNGKR